MYRKPSSLDILVSKNPEDLGLDSRLVRVVVHLVQFIFLQTRCLCELVRFERNGKSTVVHAPWSVTYLNGPLSALAVHFPKILSVGRKKGPIKLSPTISTRNTQTELLLIARFNSCGFYQPKRARCGSLQCRLF